MRSPGGIGAEPVTGRRVSGETQSAHDAEPSDPTIAIHSIARTPVRFSEDERRRHSEIIGKTGQGKSTILKNIALKDIRDGKSVVYIDPHGLDAPTLIDSMPSHRSEKVCFLDLTDSSHPVSWNPLAGVPLEKYTFEDRRREYFTKKHCAPRCTVSCVQQIAVVDNWRGPQTLKPIAAPPSSSESLVQLTRAGSPPQN